MAVNLFGTPSSRSHNKNLVEFRAGKMHLRGKMVHPDKRKGLVYIHQSSDSLMHFCWKDRTTGAVEDDLIIFPDDCEYIRVPQCTTGRVFLLKFKSSSRKYFFWMQEPKTDKDEEYCRKVNDFLNNPPTPGSHSGRTPGTPGDRDLQSLLNNMSSNQLMQLFGGVGGMSGLSSLLVPSEASGSGSGLGSRPSASLSGTTAASTTSSSASNTTSTTTAPTAPAQTAAAATTEGASANTLSNLQNILSEIQVPEAAAARPKVDLADGLTAEALQPILTNPQFMQQLSEYLSAADKATFTVAPDQALKDTVQSPQFQEALRTFSAALQSGQLGPLVSQFNLGPAAVDAANNGDLEAFVKAMQDKKDSGDDDEMALD